MTQPGHDARQQANRIRRHELANRPLLPGATITFRDLVAGLKYAYDAISPQTAVREADDLLDALCGLPVAPRGRQPEPGPDDGILDLDAIDPEKKPASR